MKRDEKALSRLFRQLTIDVFETLSNEVSFLIETSITSQRIRLRICPSQVKAKKYNEAVYGHLIRATTIDLALD